MRKIVHICDNCGKSVSETKSGGLYGPICLNVRAPQFTEFVFDVDFCGLDCAQLWLKCTWPGKIS